ncbi:MAG TPA: shikimate kinase [Bryobacteraceae bacterium]|nr:shikimate kinase [Bryobacteraceae bacterium]
MNIKLKRTPGIYLVGFMGSGKSTVGRALAHRLGWSFFDIDHEIERAEGMTIAEIFDTRGEDEFRRIESRVVMQHVRSVECGHPAVVALGGGAFAAPGTRQLLRENGVTVWLDCAFDVVSRRVAQETTRPLARDPHAFRALYLARRDTYALADVRLALGDEDAQTVVDMLLADPLLQ